MLNHNMRNFTLILTLLCIGCSTNNAMIFKDKTIYVDEFPSHFKLSSPDWHSEFQHRGFHNDTAYRR